MRNNAGTRLHLRRPGTAPLAVLAALVCTLHATAQSDDDSRVTPQGPYKSKMRIVENPKALLPTNAEAALEAVANDPYGAALLLRNLGYQAVDQGDLTLAGERLLQALQRDALAPLATNQIRADLLRLWAKAGDDKTLNEYYMRWRAAGHVFDAPEYALAARALARGAHYAAAGDALERAFAKRKNPPAAWRELQVFVLSKTGDFAAAARIKSQLMTVHDATRADWLQLASLFESAEQFDSALAAVELGVRHGALDRASDWDTLAKMYRRGGLPDHAALLLADGLSSGLLSANAYYYQALADARIAAHDLPGALEPLQQAARLGHDSALYYRAGELAHRLGDFAAAVVDLREAVRGDLGSNTGRAQLLLGEAYVETGDILRGRRAFTTASGLGGSYAQANAWLERLKKQSGKSAADAPTEQDDKTASSAAPRIVDASTLATKTVQKLKFFYIDDQVELTDLPTAIATMVRLLRSSVRRERLAAAGPLQFIVNSDLTAGKNVLDLQVGLPVRTRVPPRGRFRNRDTAPFLCVHREYRGSPTSLDEEWQSLYSDVLAAGLQPTGETRTLVLDLSADNDNMLFELQVGIVEPAAGSDGR